MSSTSVKDLMEKVDKDIQFVKDSYRLDVSPEIGRVLNSFVTYYEQREMNNEGLKRFVSNIQGLEKGLQDRIGISVSLSHTAASVYEIISLWNLKNDENIKKLKNYSDELVCMELRGNFENCTNTLIKTDSREIRENEEAEEVIPV
jgi:hypothetical protein